MDSRKFFTPHINASPNDFAKTVLMPGDPLRAKYIADTFLDDDKVLVNNVRGIQGYTGYYKGTRVSVMASGMGMPSIGLYSYELYKFFGVENIIRIGSAGGLADNVRLRDIIIGIGASTNSNFQSQYGLNGTLSAVADYTLLCEAAEEARRIGASYHIGQLLSSDTFYSADDTQNEKWRDAGMLAVEMEAAALYMTAQYLKKRALAICTVSDHVFRDEALDAEARQNSFTEMMEIALNVAINMDKK